MKDTDMNKVKTITHHIGTLIGLVSAWLCLAALNMFAEPFSDLSFDAACKKAAQTGKIVLVDFYTTWCAPCRLLDKNTWTDGAVIKLLEKETVALRLDAEKETNLANRYKIEAYPSVILIKPDGTELDRLVGYRDAKTFLADFDAALKGRDPVARAKDRVASPGTNDPMIRMSHGHSLAQKGKGAEALEEYLWCFDHGDEVRSSFDSMRLTILLDRIKDLGVRYPDARKALASRHDERQSKLLAGSTDQPIVLEIVALNGALDQKEKNLAVLDRLPVGSPIRDVVSDLIIDQLLMAKRYADILGGANGKSAFAKKVDLFNYMSDALDPKNPVRKETEEGYREYTVDAGTHYFEALAGLKRNQEGKELAQQILKFDASAATRVKLTEAANRAGNAELAQYVKQ